MPHIPPSDIECLKRTVSLLGLVRGFGHEVKKQGKDMVCRCPWHEGDNTPSCVISSKSNLWHCFGCNAGGSVIDWVMRERGVGFREACEYLQEKVGSREAGVGSKSQSLLQDDLEPAFSPDSLLQAPDLKVFKYADCVDDQQLLQRVVGFYHEALLASPEALAYLRKRKIDDAALIAHFKLGYANRSLGNSLPIKQVQVGALIRERLQRIGILRDSGHEHLAGSIVIPLFAVPSQVGVRGARPLNPHVVQGACHAPLPSAAQMYGRKLLDNLRAGTPKHLYLAGEQRGVLNADGLLALHQQNELRVVIVCEALIDALTFWRYGFKNVTSAFGVHGITEDLLGLLKTLGCRVLIAFDGDDAGDRGAVEFAAKLQTLGLESQRLHLPRGMDVNAHACKADDAAQALRALFNQDEQRQDVGNKNLCSLPKNTIEDAVDLDAIPAVAEDLEEIGLMQTVGARHAVPLQTTSSTQTIPTSTTPAATPSTEPEITTNLGDRNYRIRGLKKNLMHEQLRVCVRVMRGELVYVDQLELYSAKQRAAWVKQVSVELGTSEEILRHDLGKLLLLVEQWQEQQQSQQNGTVQTHTMSEVEREAALELLRDPSLVQRICNDFEYTGLVGEPTNALVGYLAALSRKLEHPLAIMVQSTSAAGKSTLMDCVLALVPEEDRTHYSAMTGQSLFYLGEKDLKHKILAIAEEEGVRQAAYALKVLQSQGELTIASTGKDPQTGQLVTQEYRVEGPVMLFLTTTAIDIDEELLNRCLVLTINESREQTRAIQQKQRQKRTLQGLLSKVQSQDILTAHQNAQRLIQPLAVVNPYAEQLTFMDERTRTRRDHQKYLTLIEAIALLHQYQREIKQARLPHDQNKIIDYIEVTKQDIALANQLAHEVLGKSLDELPPQSRALLTLLDRHVNTEAKKNDVPRSEIQLTRREIRNISGMSDTAVRTHLNRLVEMEYLVTNRGRQGQLFTYELLFDGDAESNQLHCMGLIDVATLNIKNESTMQEDTKNASTSQGQNATSQGKESYFAGSKRPQNGVLSVGLRGDDDGLQANENNDCSDYNLFMSKKALIRAEKNEVFVVT